MFVFEQQMPDNGHKGPYIFNCDGGGGLSTGQFHKKTVHDPAVLHQWFIL